MMRPAGDGVENSWALNPRMNQTVAPLILFLLTTHSTVTPPGWSVFWCGRAAYRTTTLLSILSNQKVKGTGPDFSAIW